MVLSGLIFDTISSTFVIMIVGFSLIDVGMAESISINAEFETQGCSTPCQNSCQSELTVNGKEIIMNSSGLYITTISRTGNITSELFVHTKDISKETKTLDRHLEDIKDSLIVAITIIPECNNTDIDWFDLVRKNSKLKLLPPQNKSSMFTLSCQSKCPPGQYSIPLPLEYGYPVNNSFKIMINLGNVTSNDTEYNKYTDDNLYIILLCTGVGVVVVLIILILIIVLWCKNLSSTKSNSVIINGETIKSVKKKNTLDNRTYKGDIIRASISSNTICSDLHVLTTDYENDFQNKSNTERRISSIGSVISTISSVSHPGIEYLKPTDLSGRRSTGNSLTRNRDNFILALPSPRVYRRQDVIEIRDESNPYCLPTNSGYNRNDSIRSTTSEGYLRPIDSQNNISDDTNNPNIFDTQSVEAQSEVSERKEQDVTRNIPQNVNTVEEGTDISHNDATMSNEYKAEELCVHEESPINKKNTNKEYVIASDIIQKNDDTDVNINLSQHDLSEVNTKERPCSITFPGTSQRLFNMSNYSDNAGLSSQAENRLSVKFAAYWKLNEDSPIYKKPSGVTKYEPPEYEPIHLDTGYIEPNQLCIDVNKNTKENKTVTEVTTTGYVVISNSEKNTMNNSVDNKILPNKSEYQTSVNTDQENAVVYENIKVTLVKENETEIREIKIDDKTNSAQKQYQNRKVITKSTDHPSDYLVYENLNLTGHENRQYTPLTNEFSVPVYTPLSVE